VSQGQLFDLPEERFKRLPFCFLDEVPEFFVGKLGVVALEVIPHHGIKPAAILVALSTNGFESLAIGIAILNHLLNLAAQIAEGGAEVCRRERRRSIRRTHSSISLRHVVLGHDLPPGSG